MPPSAGVPARRADRQAEALQCVAALIVVAEERNSMHRLAVSRIAAEGDGEPPPHPAPTRRRGCAEVRMVEAQPFVLEQLVSRSLGVELREDLVDQLLVRDKTAPVVVSVWPGDEVL